jgi:hypothetical protein
MPAAGSSWPCWPSSPRSASSTPSRSAAPVSSTPSPVPRSCKERVTGACRSHRPRRPPAGESERPLLFLNRDPLLFVRPLSQSEVDYFLRPVLGSHGDRRGEALQPVVVLHPLPRDRQRTTLLRLAPADVDADHHRPIVESPVGHSKSLPVPSAQHHRPEAAPGGLATSRRAGGTARPTQDGSRPGRPSAVGSRP